MAPARARFVRIPLRAARGPAPERAAGILPTVLGVAIMLGLLAVCSHVAVGLWERTSTESVAYDAVREVATAPDDGHDVRRRAIERARERLGGRSADVDMYFVDAGPEVIALHVRSGPVGLLPVIAGRVAIVGGLDRTITIRREQETPG